VNDILERKVAGQTPFFLTFDDGGVSAATLIADLLEKSGWRGHFLITGGQVDRPAFLSSAQIRELKARGHVIGAHSWSHPERISLCTWADLLDEWHRSVSRLSDLVGEQVTVASVPGGYFTNDVARAASLCGIRALFTSEPVKKCHMVDDCLVLGRFMVSRGMSPSAVAALCSTAGTSVQAKQYVLWNLKKAAKFVGGKYYLKVRTHLLTQFMGNANIP
jgi:peptidoglycan/xylan/chitin deacetylase (PgdA/CDA1 family)